MILDRSDREHNKANLDENMDTGAHRPDKKGGHAQNAWGGIGLGSALGGSGLRGGKRSRLP